MKHGADIEHIATQPGDESFHHARRMFCIIDNQIKIAPANSGMSHNEWFAQEGWVNDDNLGEFINTTPRGFFLSSTNRLHVYKGFDFSFDQELIDLTKKKLPDLQTALELQPDTAIFLGPKDESFHGNKYEVKLLGKLKDLL